MQHNLSDKWTAWYHHINDNNWTEESYMRLYDITTINDYWKLMNTINTFTSGMFYVMRENVLPRWEDVNNFEGGFWSFRVMKKDADVVWRNVVSAMIGNTLTKTPTDMMEINGVSISPKINNCIIKIWNKDFTKNNVNILSNELHGIILKDSLYKKHQDQLDFSKQ